MRIRLKLALSLVLVIVLVFSLANTVWSVANCENVTSNAPEYTLATRIQFFLIAINLSAPPDIDIGIWVHYHGVLTAGKGAIVTAKGYLLTQLARNIVKEADVGFKLSFTYPPQNETSGETIGLPASNDVVLYHFPDASDSRLFMEQPSQIYWPDAGDYAPTIKVFYWNHTEVQAVFPNFAIHVEPQSEIVTEQVNCVNTGLTYALVIFGVIEILDVRGQVRELKMTASSWVANRQKRQTSSKDTDT